MLHCFGAAAVDPVWRHNHPMFVLDSGIACSRLENIIVSC